MTNFIIGVPGPPGPPGPPGSNLAIQVAFGPGSASSVSQVPAGATITAVGILVKTAFTGGSGPTATVSVNGVNVLPISGQPNPADLTTLGTYWEFPIIPVATASVVTVTFGGTATAGSAIALVLFSGNVES